MLVLARMGSASSPPLKTKPPVFWDLSCRPLAKLEGHGNEIVCASFSPDGKFIVTGSSDKTVRIWRIRELDELLVQGCLWLKDYLATYPKAREELKFCHKTS